MVYGRCSAKTGSGHPIGMFYSKAAKTVTFLIIMNLHFVFLQSWVHCSTISIFFFLNLYLNCWIVELLSKFFFLNYWIVTKSALVHSKWDISNEVFVFMVLETLIFTSLNISKNKPQGWFCATESSLLKTSWNFSLIILVPNFEHFETKYLISLIFHLRFY